MNQTFSQEESLVILYVLLVSKVSKKVTFFNMVQYV